MIEGLTVASSPPPTAQYDFGTASSPVGSGYTRVSDATVYSSGLGYGWTALNGTSGSQDRGAVAGTTAVTEDFVYTQDGTFQVDLPNGSYVVTLTLGDASNGYSHTTNVYLQGGEVGTIATTAGQFATPTYVATVTNGHLVVRLQGVSGTGGDGYAVIEGLTVAPV